MTENEILIHLSRIEDNLFEARKLIPVGQALTLVEDAYRHVCSVRGVLQDEHVG